MDKAPDEKEKKVLIATICLCVMVYLIGWVIPLIEIDAAQYANISREMLQNKLYLQIYDRGLDYLDKPPMLFWLSALSMRFFGVNDAAYRLPSFLFAVLAVYSTYRLALLFYNKRIALLAALVLASSQAMFLVTHDVRTDTMLMGWVIFSIWQLAAWYGNNAFKHLLLAACGIAGGMMTKGPIALMVVIFSFAPHFILNRYWKQLFRWQYLLVLGIIAVLLIPMDIGLYRQFDLHPEKVMYGKAGTSGLRFFYWTQSFGRITGESTWSENAHFYFLFENLLWGFLPWTIFFILGLAADIRQLFPAIFDPRGRREWITTGGFLVTYCALGISKYQLPHYIYVVLPLAAIITAKWIFRLLYTNELLRWRRPLLLLHSVVFAMLAVVLAMLLYFPFPPANKLCLILLILAIAVVIVNLRNKWLPIPALIALPVFAILTINIFVDTGFYPKLLQYQSGVKLSEIIKEKNWDKTRMYIYQINEDRTLHFYSNHFFPHVSNPDSLRKGDLIFTSKRYADSLDLKGFEFLDTIGDFHVSALTLPFLNPNRRAREITTLYLLRHL